MYVGFLEALPLVNLAGWYPFSFLPVFFLGSVLAATFFLNLLLVFKQNNQKPFMKAVHKPVFDEDFTFNDTASGIALSGRNWQYFEHSIEPFVNDHSLLQFPDQNETLERIDCIMPKAKNHLTNTSQLTSTRIPSNGRHLPLQTLTKIGRTTLPHARENARSCQPECVPVPGPVRVRVPVAP